jgi:hypothetical protein
LRLRRSSTVHTTEQGDQTVLQYSATPEDSGQLSHLRWPASIPRHSGVAVASWPQPQHA